MWNPSEWACVEAKLSVWRNMGNSVCVLSISEVVEFRLRDSTEQETLFAIDVPKNRLEKFSLWERRFLFGALLRQVVHSLAIVARRRVL